MMESYNELAARVVIPDDGFYSIPWMYHDPYHGQGFIWKWLDHAWLALQAVRDDEKGLNERTKWLAVYEYVGTLNERRSNPELRC